MAGAGGAGGEPVWDRTVGPGPLWSERGGGDGRHRPRLPHRSQPSQSFGPSLPLRLSTPARSCPGRRYFGRNLGIYDLASNPATVCAVVVCADPFARFHIDMWPVNLATAPLTGFTVSPNVIKSGDTAIATATL